MLGFVPVSSSVNEEEYTYFPNAILIIIVVTECYWGVVLRPHLQASSSLPAKSAAIIVAVIHWISRV
jgi:hypothetical protein